VVDGASWASAGVIAMSRVKAAIGRNVLRMNSPYVFDRPGGIQCALFSRS
jgi:hypothetical protein